MTTLHGPVVNINGADRKNLIEAHRKVIEAALELQAALGEAFPHGRDYQTAPAGMHAADREVYGTHCLAVSKIIADYRRVGERLVTEQFA